MAGELWTALEQENANNIRKWLYGTVLVRDWDPAGSTSLAGFTPFVAGGNLVTTLMSPSNPGGPWFDFGYLDDNGVEFTPKYTTDEVDVWQTRWPVRIDATKDGEEITVVCAETNPVVDAVFNNLPLSNLASESALQSVGQSGYQVTYSNVPQIIYRQLLIIGVDAALSSAIYVVEIRPKTSMIKPEKRSFNAKKADMFGMTFGCYPDPVTGYAKSHVYGGPGWLQLGGSPILAVPDYVSLAPPTVNAATIVPSTLAGTPSTTGGSFAAGTYYWTQTATTAAGESLRGNEITATLTGSTSSNVLTWTAVSGATGYKIYRGTSAGAEGVLVTTIGSGATVTYTDTGSAGSAGSPPVVNSAVLPAPTGLGVTPSGTGGLLPAATDFWKVTAVTATGGETTGSNEVTATLTGSTSSAALTWTAVTGATGYRIYRGAAAGAEAFLAGYATSNSFTDTGSSVNATALASHQVQLQWQDPASNNTPFTYTITQTTGGSTTAATIVSAPSTTASGFVTAVVGSLIATNVYTFNVTVAAGDGVTATYPASNSITST